MSQEVSTAASDPARAEDLIFLFSLPRSGSTLLQRILMQSPLVHATSEPWVLLPMFQALRSGGDYADYDTQTFRRALADLPNGEDGYRAAVRAGALQFYGGLCGDVAAGHRILDKTPRYHLIADEILQTFPESRAVLLWRNPLAVAASIMSTWNGGRWNLYNYRQDLYDGLRHLLDAQQRWGERLHVLRYEDLVTDPHRTAREVFSALDLPFETAFVDAGAASVLPGIMGDETGQHDYAGVSTAPLQKFPSGLGNPLRRRWARRYLQWIGDEALERMGYGRAETLGRLDDVPAGLERLGSDAVRQLWGQVAVWAEPQLLHDKLRARRAGRPAVRHR